MKYDFDLFDAVEMGNTDAVALYWKSDIDVDYQDLNGMSMLMYAAYYGHTDIVHFLLDRGASPILKNKEGQTALHIALTNNHPEIAQLL